MKLIIKYIDKKIPKKTRTVCVIDRQKMIIISDPNIFICFLVHVRTCRLGQI